MGGGGGGRGRSELGRLLEGVVKSESKGGCCLTRVFQSSPRIFVRGLGTLF